MALVTFLSLCSTICKHVAISESGISAKAGKRISRMFVGWPHFKRIFRHDQERSAFQFHSPFTSTLMQGHSTRPTPHLGGYEGSSAPWCCGGPWMSIPRTLRNSAIIWLHILLIHPFVNKWFVIMGIHWIGLFFKGERRKRKVSSIFMEGVFHKQGESKPKSPSAFWLWKTDDSSCCDPLWRADSLLSSPCG